MVFSIDVCISADEEEDDFFGDPLAKGMLILTPDMDQWGNGAIGSKDQVINMGDI